MLMNPSLGKIWCVAQIKNNLYDTAIQNLKRQGFETFLPKMKITKREKTNFLSRTFMFFLDMCL